jgi:hypothetical protein
MIGTISIWLPHENQLEEVRKLENLTSIVILGEVEFHYNGLLNNKQVLLDICDFADSKGIPVYFITGLSNLDSNLLSPDDPLLGRFHIIYWPTYWFSYTFKYLNLEKNKLHNSNLGIDIEEIIPFKDYSHTFLSMNNQPHVHRCILMDMFEKHNLFENNKVSFRKQTEYDFKYWAFKILSLDQEQVLHTNLNREQLPACYNDCFMQVVTESESQTKYTLSGSTALPLLLGKPFLTLGRVGYTKFLESFGFKRYDEIFNYEYDSITDIYERTETLAIELNRIQNNRKEWANMYNSIYPKLVYNRRRAIELALDIKNFPSIWLKIAEQNYIPNHYIAVNPKSLLQDITNLYDKFKTKI